MAPTRKRSRPSSSRLLESGLVVLAAALCLDRPGAAQQGGVSQIIIGDKAARIAIPACVPKKPDEASAEACRTVQTVLRNDLEFEGLFTFVPESLLAAVPAQNPDAPNFTDWKGVDAKYLVITRTEVAGGELNVEVRVHFVDAGQTILSKRYSGKADNPRIFAHQASDDILATAQYRGVARTRIAFTSDRDGSAERAGVKELYIADYDGFNPRRVTVNYSLNILPAWNPDGRSLAYTSYRQDRTPMIFYAHIFEARSTPNVTGEKNNSQAFAPSFSPDGKRIAYASNRSGNMDIWVANVDGSSPRRLTTGAASDTAPCWSPTGQEIAFTSNRAGTPQIYLMDAEGLNVRRLTNVGDYNDAPAWNPSKQFSEIAYTARLERGGFDIAVIDLATREIRQLTEGRGSCEYPSWAPNGRHLVFGCDRGNKKWDLTVSDRDGRTLRTLATGPGNNVQPDWGP
jgi:TolB protein